MELTEFDKAIMRLHWVALRMQVMCNEFGNINTKTEDGKWLQSILREYMIIQLLNFIKIRRTLIKIDNLKEIDQCLKPLWAPILEHEKAIKELRDSYFAHMQERKPFDKYIEDIMIEHQFPNNFGDVLFFSGCVYLYYDAFSELFKKEIEKSKDRYNIFRPVITPYGRIHKNNVTKELIKAKNQAKKNLNKLLQHESQK